jgi:hypothetical protein
MPRRIPLAFLLGLSFASPALGQPASVKDPADLFPADTLFFAELTRPADVARDVEALIRGSILDDLPSYMAKLRGKNPDRFGYASEGPLVLSSLLGPEAMAEFKRGQGAALAITGINKKGEPDFVGFVLTGESNVPGFFMRAYLSSSPFVRSVGQVEGANVYLETMGRDSVPVPPGGAPPAPPPPLPVGPCFAQLPGIVIIGSNKEVVGDVIRRAKKKEQKPSLANSASFAEAGRLRQRAGLFFFANPVVLADQVETNLQKSANRLDQQDWDVLKELVNPKALRSFAGSLSLSDGNLDLQLSATLDPKLKSPLVELFTNHPLNAAVLQPVPKDAALMFTLPLNDGAQRWQKLLAVADAVAKASGQIGATPGEAIKEIEGRLKVSLGNELFGRIASITVVMPAKQELPKGGTGIPMLMIAATDAAATERLEQVIPPLLGLMVGDNVDPVTETLQGLKIRSLPGSAFPWKTPLHYGRKGTNLVIGQDRKLVAAALNRDLKDSLAADSRFLNGVKDHGDSAFLGCWQWAETLAYLALPDPPSGVGGKANAPPPAGSPRAEMEKHLRPFLDQARKLPSLVVSLSRQEDDLRLIVRQPELKAAASKLIDSGMELFLNAGSRASATFQKVGDAIPVPVKD